MNAYGHVVTRVRAALVDGYGGQRVRDWDNAEREEAGATVQPVTVKEETTGRQVITSDRKVHTALEFVETDRLEWDGKTFEVSGVEEFHNSGRFDHYEITLRLIEEPAT